MRKNGFVFTTIAAILYSSTNAFAQTAAFCIPTPAPGVTCVGDVQSDAPALNFGEIVWVGRVENGSLEIGNGGLVLIGPGSVDDANPYLSVGESGNLGVVNVTGTGQLQIVGNDSGAFIGVGNGPGSVGVIDITNGGSVFMSDTNVSFDGIINRDVYVDVGSGGGEGQLFMDAGTLLLESNSTSGLSVSSAGNSVGTMLMENGSSLTLKTTGDDANKGLAELRVGRNDGGNNKGTLEVFDSSILLDAPNGYAGFDIGEFESTGTAVFSGIAASLMLDGLDSQIRIGDGAGGFGSVVVTDGAQITIDGSNWARLAVGATEDAVGTLDILGGATVSVVGPNAIMDIGDPSPDAGVTSTGIVRVSGAGSLLGTETDILVGKNSGSGSTTGILIVSDSGKVQTPFLKIGDGGFLGGSGGTVAADLLEVALGGVIGPGVSPGALTIDGNLNMNGGIMDIEIEGSDPGEFDVLNVLGDVSSGGMFDLILTFIDYEPEVNSVFSFLEIGGDVDPDFFANARISFFGLGSGSQFSLVTTGSGLGIRADAVVSVVPIPPSIVLLAGALLGLFGWKRRIAAYSPL